VHKLKVTILREVGNGNAAELLDFLQLVPVDQDSVDIGQTAAVSFAKIYKPVFDMGGFAIDTRGGGSKTFVDLTEFAVPYQVADPTVYTKTSKTITGLGNTVNEITGNYVVVYRKDKWTRVAEGAITGTEFTCELPDGEYYYQEIQYVPTETPGALGYRTFISEGMFNIGTGIPTHRQNVVKSYVNGNTLIVDGIEAGARISIYDVTGKIVANGVATSSQFTQVLKPSVYLVKVVSSRDNFVNKVIIK
jgi:hypothetical protein